MTPIRLVSGKQTIVLPHNAVMEGPAMATKPDNAIIGYV